MYLDNNMKINANQPISTNKVHIEMTSVDAAYVIISNLTSFLSVAGCMVIIACYIGFRGIRTTSRLLLVCLSVANIFQAGATLFQSGTYYKSVQLLSEASFLCQSAAGMMTFAQVCCALWTVAITVYLAMCVSGGCITVANRVIFLFHAFCWLMPLVVSFSAEVSQVYGYQVADVVEEGHPTVCWISDRVANPLPWYLLTVEGWVMAAFCIVATLYLVISYSIYCKKTVGKEINGDDVIEELAVQTANEQLRFIPVIYVSTRIWGTAYFLFTRYAEDSRLRSYDWLMIIKAIGDNSQGLANAIFFCLATQQIRKIVANRVRKCCFWTSNSRVVNGVRWARVPSIVRTALAHGPRRRNIDESDLDLSGITLDLPHDGDLGAGEDDVIFER